MTEPLTNEQRQKLHIMREAILNASTARTEWLRRLMDPRRNINQECGYPDRISIDDYRMMFERELGVRVVSAYPDGCWRKPPMVWEDEDPEVETEFEEQWQQLNKEHHFWHYLHRVDVMSGVGRYGILLLGINDGKKLDEAVESVPDDEKPTSANSVQHKLTFLRPFDESCVTSYVFENDQTSPRFGKPTYYTVTIVDPEMEAQAAPNPMGQSGPGYGISVKIHWSRVLHVADNRGNSEVFGRPRQQPVFNRLIDIRKTCGGSAEMFWKGGFPGYSFEIDPQIKNPQLDPDEFEKEVQDFQDGLRRYMLLEGITAKSMAMQVADPRGHMQTYFQLISAITKIPIRILLGSERGELSSTQDTVHWNEQLEHRNVNYTEPLLLRPFVQRLQAMNVLPYVEEFGVTWPDLNTQSEKDHAEVVKITTEALAQYIGGGVSQLVPEEFYLKHFFNLEPDEVRAILDAAMEQMELEDAAAQEMNDATGQQPDADAAAEDAAEGDQQSAA